jgi:hypothetical protein
VKVWKRGEPMASARTVYEGKESDVAAAGVVFHNPAGTIAVIQRAVTFFTSEYYWLASDGTTRQLPLPPGADLKGAQGDKLLVTLREDWSPPAGVAAGNENPRPIRQGSLIACRVAVGANAVHLDVRTLYTPDEHSAIDEVAAGRDAVYVSINHDVTGSIRVFRPGADGSWNETTLALPAAGSTHIVTVNDWGPEAQFRFESFTTPTTLYATSADGTPAPIKSLPARFDATNLATEQFFATSKDGTRVPYFVTRSRSLTGPAPTVLYGYGGFEISLTPSYSANFGMLWLTRGGVYVVANIRGGGEYGPAWHQAALLQNRQKAYDDFQAVAVDLVRRGITTAKQLGIMGGSNGGLLVSANMVERPELFGAVVCQVPLIDMIRYTHIGAGASWISLKKRSISGIIGIGLLFGPIIINSSLIVPVGTELAERLLYPASVAACAIAAFVVYRAIGSRFRLVVIVLLILLFSLQSWSAQRPWRNQLDLYAYGAEAEPLSARLHLNQGMNLLYSRDVPAAAWHFMVRTYIMTNFPNRVDPMPIFQLEQLPVELRIAEGPAMFAPEDPCRFLGNYFQFLEGKTPHLAPYVRNFLSGRYPDCANRLSGQTPPAKPQI